MTSIPLSFWPNNLSSLFWMLICLALLVGSVLDQNAVFNVNWRNVMAWCVLVGIGGFAIDQLILGPMFWWYNGR
jgi:hypothetical protein